MSTVVRAQVIHVNCLLVEYRLIITTIFLSHPTLRNVFSLSLFQVSPSH